VPRLWSNATDRRPSGRIGVEDGDHRLSSRPLKILPFSAAMDSSEPMPGQMRALGVGHQSHSWDVRCPPGKRFLRDDSCPSRPSAARCCRIQLEQREWQADIVIEGCPCVDRTAFGERRAFMMQAIISLLVVLPLLPVTPITGSAKRATPIAPPVRQAPGGCRSTCDQRQAQRRVQTFSAPRLTSTTAAAAPRSRQRQRCN
jgi:hypothetical protein